jgi:hypothetical protein
LGEHSIAAKVAGELRSRDGVSHIQMSSVSAPNIRNLREKRKSRSFAVPNLLTRLRFYLRLFMLR